MKSIGLDFGTTNSAVAGVRGSDPVIANFKSGLGLADTFASILYFEQVHEDHITRLRSWAGPFAIERYLEREDRGRLIQSLKAYLADRRFDATMIFSKPHTLEDMVAHIVRHLLESAVNDLGSLSDRVVVGRPVHFSNAFSESDDDFASARLLAAIRRCGFEHVMFEYEPVAAAYSYERTLDRDELILIGDFGGGTSDFSILHVGPGVRQKGRQREDIVGYDGVAVAGDAFDRKIVRHVIAPRLGKDSQYISPPNKFLPVPSWPYDHLERWHYLSFLNNAKNIEMLENIERHALIPERIAAFIDLIKSERGYQLHEAVRQAKFQLSAETETTLSFECGGVMIAKKVTRPQFEQWIEEELNTIAACVDRLLANTGVAAKDIDHVFLTGGSAFVPAVRRIFADRFGVEKITGGREMISVALGLALRANEEWGA